MRKEITTEIIPEVVVFSLLNTLFREKNRSENETMKTAKRMIVD